LNFFCISYNNKLSIRFSNWIFTTDATKDWWSYPIDETSKYSIQISSFNYYKEKGFGVIMRDSRLPPIEKSKSSFSQKWI
jgi:hypothetical protein